MIAENKQEFFEQLERELQRLGVEDSSELIFDLEEHFAEGTRRGESESEICRELGSIAEIARSCLDLKSSAINSMVARDVSRKRVSLTKPGRSVPADPSLAPNAINSEQKAEEDCVRSYTPEHIAEETVPSSGSAAGSFNQSGAFGYSEQSGAAGSPNQSGTASSPNQSGAASSPNQSGAASSPNQDGAAGSPNQSSANGTFEKIGKTVDEVCDKAGKALNQALGKAESAIGKAGEKVGEKVNAAAGTFRPSDSYRSKVNRDKHADIPPQSAEVKTKGKSVFVDTTGLQPNVNLARLIKEIILDVLLWIWLIITLFAIVVACFAGTVALVVCAVSFVFGPGYLGEYRLITRILFGLGILCLSGVSANLGGLLKNPAVALVKYVISRHLKAIYDI